jgi:hypothetical protein
MMLLVMPKYFIRMKLMSADSGNPTSTVTTDPPWRRNTITTSETMIASSVSASFNVATARSMSSERSYAVRTVTPCGRPFCNSASRVFTRSMTAFAFSP